MVGLRSVQRAVILAAGNGDRFQSGSHHSKLLATVSGVPLIVRTLTCAAEAGITDAHVVLGFDAAAVQHAVARGAPAGLRVRFHLNHEWHKENGLSALVTRRQVGAQPFALLMADHLFEPPVLRRLLNTPTHAGETLLAVDSGPARPDVVAEATKVRMTGDRVTAIGKDLAPHDALDTGMFVCQSSVFDALDNACALGDTTLSGGIRRLAACRLVRGVDIGRAMWFDVDTMSDLSTACSRLASGLP
jgi:1L-myo-inositol 1-phosphate cytidylyltransferase